MGSILGWDSSSIQVLVKSLQLFLWNPADNQPKNGQRWKQYLLARDKKEFNVYYINLMKGYCNFDGNKTYMSELKPNKLHKNLFSFFPHGAKIFDTRQIMWLQTQRLQTWCRHSERIHGVPQYEDRFLCSVKMLICVLSLVAWCRHQRMVKSGHMKWAWASEKDRITLLIKSWGKKKKFFLSYSNSDLAD